MVYKNQILKKKICGTNLEQKLWTTIKVNKLNKLTNYLINNLSGCNIGLCMNLNRWKKIEIY